MENWFSSQQGWMVQHPRLVAFGQDLVFGGISASIAKTIVAPIERVKVIPLPLPPPPPLPYTERDRTAFVLIALTARHYRRCCRYCIESIDDDN
jgi:hypothetical protein